MGTTNKSQEERIATIKKIIDEIHADPEAMRKLKAWMKIQGYREVIVRKKKK